ncbi:contactin-4-like isoform X2 [Littorina saxatilis]|uniref:Ig-like domain-containing protein n=1 Tax=Littorina saxatilis TaxID=31220 RepID=A0AAN9G219_9CAEN
MAGGTRLASTLLLSVFLFVRAQDDTYEPPKIVEPAAARQEFHKGGEDVTLQCRASGQPVPIYEWYRNGALVEDNGYISYNPPSGILTIRSLTTREEGFYNCRARNTFPNGLSAVVISPKIEVIVARIVRGVRSEQGTVTVTEGNYVFMTCGDTPLEYYGPTTFEWLYDFGRLGRDDQIFIDIKGELHFAYVMHTDDGSEGYYTCSMHNSIQGLSIDGRQTSLVVIQADSMSGVEPTLQFSSKMAGQAALTFERNTEGWLECFFSGYALKTQRRRVLEALPETEAANGSERYAAEEQQMKSARLPDLAMGDQDESATDPDIEVPTIEWQDNAGNTIVSGTDRYTIESHGRVLKIARLEEADEQTYTCIGRNTMGTAEGRMTINVTTSPVWVKPLQSTTVPRGQDAVFHCQARSAAGEVAPDPPRWFKNGHRLDVMYDSNKFEFSDKLRELRVKSVHDTDVGCFHCYVSNSEGEEVGNGCLTIFLPIRIAAKPPAKQTIEKGDIVNLTVVATADKLYPVAYKWHFNDITYEGVSAPPHVIYDINTKQAYINTSDLTDQQMRDIRGVYRREVYCELETVFVDVDVKLKVQEGLPEIPVASADPHVVVIAVLGAVGGILILVIVLLVVLYKMKGKLACIRSPNGRASYAVSHEAPVRPTYTVPPEDDVYSDPHYSEIPDDTLAVYEECHTYLELLGDTDEDGYLRPLDFSPETTAVEETNG